MLHAEFRLGRLKFTFFKRRFLFFSVGETPGLARAVVELKGLSGLPFWLQRFSPLLNFLIYLELKCL